MQSNEYSTIIIDPGSGVIKGGFGGEDGPRINFNSLVATPKQIEQKMVGMDPFQRYVGDYAMSKLEIMDFSSPIKRGEVSDWDKFETLMHYLFYSELKVVPEEISVLITENPCTSKQNRAKLSEILFETFNINKLYIANSSMTGLFSYGKTTGLIVDSGFNCSSSVPIYEGFPLEHASVKENLGGEDLSLNLLDLIKDNIDPSYVGLKGRLSADGIKEAHGFLSNDKSDTFSDPFTYKMPDGKTINLDKEVYLANECLFTPDNNLSIQQLIETSIDKCHENIQNEIKENISLTGGTTLLKNFPSRLKNELSKLKKVTGFNITFSNERKYSAWIGGSIVSSLETFQYMWVTKEEFDESRQSISSIDAKCF